jgi:polyisoprenoid-binding protein YceI
MKIRFALVAVLLAVTSIVSAQIYNTKTGVISFVSDAKLEKIQAVNKQVNAALNINTGEFGFKVLIKSFEFEKALMQEHFNENYMESDKFPLSTFNGKIVNLKDINFTKDGVYNAVVEGDLTIHGITNKVKEAGSFEVKAGKIRGRSQFTIKLSEYKITIPTAVFNKLSETIQIDVDVTLEKKQ